MHPYKEAAHKRDPKWMKNLNQYVEKAAYGDVEAVIRNYGGDKAITEKAAYCPPQKGESD